MAAVHHTPLLLLALVASDGKPVELPADPLAQVSVNGTSLETVSAGRLLGGAFLEAEGPHHEGLAAHRKRSNRYGVVELVALVRAAAARVAERFPGSRLQVGNLSKRGGGDLLGISVSHNSGRDADLALYALDAGGSGARPSNLVPYGDDGVSLVPRGRYRFDVPRNWALVRALLGDASSGADVQWLFISDGLRRLLLDHAAAAGEDEAVVAKAEKILRQPTGSSSHNDHIHLRVYCPIDDRLDGCRDYGPVWDWVPDRKGPLRARSRAVAGVLEDPRQPLERRLRSVQLLESIRGTDATAWLVAATRPGRDRALRLRTLQALRAIQVPAAAAPLAALLPGEEDAEVAASLLDTLAVLGDDRVWPLVAGLLHDERVVEGPLEQEPRAPARRELRVTGERSGRETVGARAASTLGHLLAAEAVVVLVEALGSSARTERRRASEALRRLSNADPESVRWSRRRLSDRKVAAGQAAWRQWWQAHRGAGRDVWLAEGFSEQPRGLPEGAALLSQASVPALLRLVRHQDRWVALNARETLRRIARLNPWHPGDPFLSLKWWKRWWALAAGRDTPTTAVEVGLRAILGSGSSVPVRTRSQSGIAGPLAWARAHVEEPARRTKGGFRPR